MLAVAMRWLHAPAFRDNRFEGRKGRKSGKGASELTKLALIVD
jgi:hypothetical protein